MAINIIIIIIKKSTDKIWIPLGKLSEGGKKVIKNSQSQLERREKKKWAKRSSHFSPSTAHSMFPYSEFHSGLATLNVLYEYEFKRETTTTHENETRVQREEGDNLRDEGGNG